MVGKRVHTTNDLVAPTVPLLLTGEDSSTVGADTSWYYVAPFSGSFDIEDIIMQLATTGGATGSLNCNLDVNVGTNSIFTTAPSISKSAANGAHTHSGATGVVKGVINPAREKFNKGDVIRVRSRRSGTPSTNPANLRWTVGLTPNQDYDPDSSVARS